MLIKQDGRMTKLTQDQTPSREDERNRIEENDGLVTMKNGVARVDGSIAVSRAIGDIQYKKFLIPEPETQSHAIEDDDDLLVLSTDGLFLVYGEERVGQMIHEMRQQSSLKTIAQKITDECCTNYYCRDNLTLLIVDLKKYHTEYQQMQ